MKVHNNDSECEKTWNYDCMMCCYKLAYDVLRNGRNRLTEKGS